jgi:DNA-binding PadR family transcriptional regulator
MDSTQHAFELTGFQRDLLYAIAGQYRPSGQAIRRELAQWIDVGHGQLYTNLDVLADKSLIKKGSKNQRTNYYEITDAGLTLLRRRREWENKYLTEAMTGVYYDQSGSNTF